MARVVRGKGKRQQVIEVTRNGAMLRTRENAGGDLRLPGYRRCTSDAAAQAALEAEVRRHLAAGMSPADEAATAIAAAMPTADEGPPSLPLRRDLGVYNEATGMVCTARRMAGKQLEEGSDAWMRAVARGDLLPVSLVQDDPFVLRVVAGAPLAAQETEEWVARVDWHLNLSDGRLCITGGAPFSNEDYAEDEAYHEAFVAEVAVPKGRYRATLYVLAHGLNGAAALDEAAGGGYDSHEPFDAWWRRTRGDEPMPDFDALEDPVEFLLHLEPVEKAPPKRELSALPESGWFAGIENARQPAACPRGLLGSDVVRRERVEDGDWTYVRDVAEMVGPGACGPIAGAPVDVPLDEFHLVARLAWFASRWVVFEVRGTGASADALAAVAWPPEVVAVEEAGELRLLFDSDVEPHLVFDRLAGIARAVASVPGLTALELLAAPAAAMHGEPGDEGRMRLRGTLRQGVWRIDAARPAVDATTLRDALALAREASTGPTITCADAREAQAVMARVRAMFGPHLREDPPAADGRTIRNRAGGHDLLLAASAAFALRFGSTWPVAAFDPFDESADEDDDDLLESAPIRGPHVWTAPGGRGFHETMAMLMSDGIASAITTAERAFRAERWPHAGDLVCDALENIGLRGYARDGGDTWGILLCWASDGVRPMLASRFEDGTLLITSTDGDVRDDATGRVRRTGLAGANTRDLMKAHAARLAELGATLGPASPTVSTVQAFAEALDPILDAIA